MEGAIVLSSIVGVAILAMAIYNAVQKYGDRKEAKGRWKSEVDKDREIFKEFIEKVEGKLDEILEHFSPRLIATNSPLQLTETGEKISEEIEGKEWAYKVAEGIKENTSGMSPYEIQSYCKELVKLRYIFNEDEKFLIGKSAYENGISRDKVLDVLIIELRNQLLKIHGIAD